MSAPSSLQLIPVSAIRTSPFQYRVRFDDEKQRWLVDSMRASGLSTPLLVRPIPATEKGESYELVSGERRWRAATALGWTDVLAVVEPMVDTEAASRLVTENEVRADTNILEKAAGYKRLTEPPCNMTLEEIAKRYGLAGASSVSRIIGLLNQPKPIQDLLSQDKIGEAHVRYLSKIKDLLVRSKWAKRAAEGGWTVKETEKRVSDILAKAHKVPAKSRTKPAPTQEYDYNGFHCALVGDEVVITGRNFKRSKDVPAQFIDDFGSALTCFLRDLAADESRQGDSDSPASEASPPATNELATRDASVDPLMGAEKGPAAPGSEAEEQPMKEAFAELANMLGLTEGQKKEGEGLSLDQLVDLLHRPKAG